MSTIRVYNTMTRKKEEFVPLHPGKVGIYVCGVTPYNHPHIGNAVLSLCGTLSIASLNMKAMM